MTPHSRIRRIGWIAALATCTALYLALHLKVHSVRSDVIAAERQIVALEQRKLLLETEFETRANQLQLAAWNTIDFGYTAPTARQFLENERQLVSFGSPRAPSAPEPIRVARFSGAEEPAFPTLVSSSVGRPIDLELIEAAGGERLAAAGDSERIMRIPLGAVMGVEAR
jgi:hypothetical protein